MLISRRAVADFQSRDFDSFLWMKTLSKERLLQECRRMRTRPTFKTEPWQHQLVCFVIGVYCPEFLFLLDMGLGKSKIILDLITHARREKRLKRALVCVPRKINVESWSDDIPRHSDLGAQLIRTENIEEKWEQLIEPSPGEMTVIDYQSLHWALSKRRGGRGKKRNELVPDEARVRKVRRVYNFVNMDESHKLGNHESLWFALMRRLTGDNADNVFATTGTLYGKDPMLLWPQFFLVDRGETFGENMGLFRASFFKQAPNPWGRGEKYEYDPSTAPMLHKMLQNRSLRYDESEVLELPARVPRIEQYTMGDEQREHYMNALEGLINAGGEINALDGAWVKMRRIVSGYLTWKDEHGEHVLRFKENPKLDGLESMLERSCGRSKAVVCYDYTETGRMIVERVEAMGLKPVWFYGGAKDKAGIRRRFLDDDSCRVMVMNSEAGGTGNDGLQKVAKYMFFYESPTPPITRQQTVKRIHRPGQLERTFVYDLVMRRSLDAGILADLAAAVDSHDTVVNGRRPKGRGFFLQDVPEDLI